jgi:hypothetical protein
MKGVVELGDRENGKNVSLAGHTWETGEKKSRRVKKAEKLLQKE